MWKNPQETEDLVTFTEEILNQNFIFCALQNAGICVDRHNRPQVFFNVNVLENFSKICRILPVVESRTS